MTREIYVDSSEFESVVLLPPAVVLRRLAGAVLVVPLEVLSEASLGSSGVERVRALQRLASSTGAVRIGPDVRGMLEWERDRHRTGALKYLDADLDATAAAASQDEMAGRVRSWLGKERTLNMDETARRAFPKRIFADGNRAGAVALLDRIMADMRTHLLTSRGVGFQLFKKAHAQRVRRRPGRYPHSLMVAAGIELQALSASFKDIGYGAHASVLEGKLMPGDWIDARIMGCAATGERLLTADRRLRVRTLFLGEALGLPVRGVSVDEWLNEAH
jgi:hypothetical protein